MKTSIPLMVLAASALVVACGRGPDTSEAPAEPDPASARDQATAPIAPETEQAVAKVDSVMLSRPLEEPSTLVIVASGTATSGGWTNPRLEPITGTNATTPAYRFVATSPTGPSTQALEPLEAELRVENFPPDARTVRIVAAANEIMAIVTEP